MRISTLLNDFDAVLLATGCMAASKPQLTGDWANREATELADVEYGLDFLVQLHRGEKKRVGQRVAVVGAGFTALDCARVAARLGAAEVTIHIRTSEEYIPVTREEIFEAKREGVRIKGLRTPIGLKTDANGRLAGIEFVQNRLGGWRAGGRRIALCADPQALMRLREWLRGCEVARPLFRSDFEVLCTAVHEACANVAEHGYGSDPGSTFELWYVPRAAATAVHPRLRQGYFVMRDHGRPFRADNWRATDFSDHDVWKRGRGFGLDILHRGMSLVSYHPGTAEGNLTVMTFDPTHLRQPRKETPDA
jgi:anti-sigma regulatory factor (Ser/Thr protein kinase)